MNVDPISPQVGVAAASPGANFADRQWKIGTVVSSPDPVLAERIASCFDFVWIDLEHSALGVRDAQGLAISVAAGGAVALVRVPHSESELLGAILDTGVAGVVAPKVESAEQAASLVDRVRYPPRGSRGFAPRRAAGGRASAHVIEADAGGVLCLAQIETVRAVENAAEIAAVDGIDCLIVGTSDLSLDLGTPFDLESDALRAAICSTGEAAMRGGKAWGVAMGSFPSWADSLRADGASVLVFSSDAGLYAAAIQDAAQRCRRVMPTTAA